MKFYKEVVLGTRPSNYKNKYVFLGLDKTELTFLLNHFKCKNFNCFIELNKLYLDVTDATTELLFHIWDWEVFFDGNKTVMFD